MTGRSCERVGKTIAKIQLSGMSAAFSKITIGLACNSRLDLGHWLNDYLCFLDKIVKTPAGDRIPASVDNERGFDKVGRGEATVDSPLNCESTGLCVRFVAKDCNERRCVDDHRGNPVARANVSDAKKLASAEQNLSLPDAGCASPAVPAIPR